MGAASKNETIFPTKLARVLILQNCLSTSTAAISLMFSLLLDVSVRFMFKVSISKPKNVIFCVGTNIDFVECMTNPNTCNKDMYYACGKCIIKTYVINMNWASNKLSSTQTDDSYPSSCREANTALSNLLKNHMASI